MKYENIDEINRLVKQIKKDEKELELLLSYNVSAMKIVITSDRDTVCTIGIGNYEHPYTKTANTFIEDCAQILRDKITKQKTQLEKL